MCNNVERYARIDHCVAEPRARPRPHHMRRSPMASKYSMNDRPSWPRRAIVTAGEPYGNKGLHFGHVGGVFVPADFFARFLRDRIGEQNVLFVSGTDWRAIASSRRTKATTSPLASTSSPITPARPRPSTTTTSAAISTAARALSRLRRFTTRLPPRLSSAYTSRAPSPSAPRCSSTMPRPARSSTAVR